MKITVADVVAYLSKLPQDAEVFLDKDGWMEEDFTPRDPLDLIHKRGLFNFTRWDGEAYLIINN